MRYFRRSVTLIPGVHAIALKPISQVMKTECKKNVKYVKTAKI